ncbi:hypothetical protein LCGC14_0544220 [marine sediment metagenome]|uniref:Uncharacterized protein n=1 Tax=marine sediment metagenome TaxID=412755 RepID=A0A0F9UD68_9ZZZZ
MGKEEIEEILIVCIGKEGTHTDDSLLMSCHRCGKDVWVSPHNLGKKLICTICVTKLNPKEVQFKVAMQDLLKAANFLEKYNSK